MKDAIETLDKSGLLDAIMASAKDYAIVVVGLDGQVATWNAGAHNVFGYSAAEMVGQRMDRVFTSQDRAAGVPQREIDTAREQGRAPDVRYHLRKDGSVFWADGVLQPMYNPAGALAGYVKILRDATQDHEHEASIARLARVDALTGVANRAEFVDRFQAMTATALRHDQWLIVQLIDLDHFKQVNDRFGHQIGDQLLQQVAQRIQKAVRKTDFLARLGGDEFVVLQPDADAPEAGGRLAEKIIQCLGQPFHLDGSEIRIGASVGISVFPRDATDPEELLRKSDLAMYQVKAEMRNGYHYFSQELDDQAYQRSNDLASVRRAVAKNRFSVVYQPKIDCLSGRVIATEALLRCHEPILAKRPIEDVIVLALKAGLMERIGLGVLTEACRQTRLWHDAGLSQLSLCVNVCAAEMSDPGFPGRVDAALASSGLAPQFLDLEITEREIFDSGQAGSKILADLRARGILIALDDFGTGYSSLSYLNDLLVDIIKLDKSFLRNLPQDAQDRTVVASLLGLARGLDLKVVAEGVETAEQAEFFRRERCDMMQGFYFTRPLPAAEMTAWLLDHADVNLLPKPRPRQLPASDHPNINMLAKPSPTLRPRQPPAPGASA